MRSRKGFTIVELMMVIGIIGVLLGIVTTAASSSIKQARERKADACCTLVEQAFATYYAQEGKWPGSIGEKIANGSLGTRQNQLGPDYENDPDQYELTAAEVDEMMKKLIEKTKQGNPMMDISGLFVSRKEGQRNSKDMGLDFMDAIHGTRKSSRKMTTAEMHFGYPDSSSGYFRHFWVIYSIPTDTMKVQRQPSDSRRQMQL